MKEAGSALGIQGTSMVCMGAGHPRNADGGQTRSTDTGQPHSTDGQRGSSWWGGHGWMLAAWGEGKGLLMDA